MKAFLSILILSCSLVFCGAANNTNTAIAWPSLGESTLQLMARQAALLYGIFTNLGTGITVTGAVDPNTTNGLATVTVNNTPATGIAITNFDEVELTCLWTNSDTALGSAGLLSGTNYVIANAFASTTNPIIITAFDYKAVGTNRTDAFWFANVDTALPAIGAAHNLASNIWNIVDGPLKYTVTDGEQAGTNYAVRGSCYIVLQPGADRSLRVYRTTAAAHTNLVSTVDALKLKVRRTLPNL